MAKKPGKKAGKKSSSKVRDLKVRKDPRGGAQKKEGEGALPITLPGGPVRAGRVRLS